MSQRKGWPSGITITVKCESESLAFDQRPVSFTLQRETSQEWVGWPLTWKENNLEAGHPLVFPKFAWKLIRVEGAGT